MSNYYEILGVWRDASEDDVDLAAQALADHWKGALALNDPLADDWLKIVDQARATLIDPKTREIYDRELSALAEAEREGNEEPVFSPGFPWRPYLCALLTVPVLLAAFVLVLDLIANNAFLTDINQFRDALLTAMLVSSAVAFPCGLVVLMVAAHGRREQHRLRMLTLENEVGPAMLAEIEAAGRLSEYTDVAVLVTWVSEVVIVAIWLWLVALLLGIPG
jgi:hypothetical protein